MKTSSPRRPMQVLSYEERREREQRIQEEKKRMHEEREQGMKPSNLTKEQRRSRQVIGQRDYQRRVQMNKEASDENYRRKKKVQRQRMKALEIDGQLSIKAPPKLISNEDGFRLQQIWKQQIQEEIQKMREEDEEGVWRLSLTEDQRRIRGNIRERLRASIRARTRGSPKREVSIEARLLRRAKRYMNEEERQIRDKLEQRIQEEKKRMREERTLRSKLTEEQKMIRKIIRANNEYHRQCMRREARDEKYRKKREARRQTGNSLESMKIGFILNEQ